ncbi:MAG TPA: VOC family protein [Conexibacter sp.]|nr:VOC family protein [Conexibacter sp.]
MQQRQDVDEEIEATTETAAKVRPEAARSILDEALDKGWLEALDKLTGVSAKVDRLDEERQGMERERAAIEAEEAETRARLLRESRLVGCTLAAYSMDSQLRERCFDVVILDEASSIEAPTVILAGSRARRAVSPSTPRRSASRRTWSCIRRASTASRCSVVPARGRRRAQARSALLPHRADAARRAGTLVGPTRARSCTARTTIVHDRTFPFRALSLRLRFESSSRPPGPRPHGNEWRTAMFDAMTHNNVWVTDQDRALDFYVNKLGLEVTADQDLGFMRWLTVNVPGQPDRQIILSAVQAPSVNADQVECVLRMISEGLMGMVFLTTLDCRGTYEALVGRGVTFSQEPSEQSYGVDCEARDPFGNRIRIVQTSVAE